MIVSVDSVLCRMKGADTEFDCPDSSSGTEIKCMLEVRFFQGGEMQSSMKRNLA